MLTIKPNCEWCDKDLAPDSDDARICSYECTFCAACVDNILHNVCPNCGGGFCARPIRPQHEHRAGVSLQQHPASSERVHSQWQADEVKDFSNALVNTQPQRR